MKYVFESSETETLAYVAMIERLLGKVLDLVEVDIREHSPKASEPPPGPATVATPQASAEEPAPVAAEKSEKDKRQIEHGRVLFNDLVAKWAINFGIEDAVQPDRLELLRAVATGYDATSILHYVSTVGGLTHAVDKAMSPSTEQDRKHVEALSANIMQVSSLFFTDLCSMYEYRDIYRED